MAVVVVVVVAVAVVLVVGICWYEPPLLRMGLASTFLCSCCCWLLSAPCFCYFCCCSCYC